MLWQKKKKKKKKIEEMLEMTEEVFLTAKIEIRMVSCWKQNI